MLALYRAAAGLGGPVIRAYLTLRRMRGKEESARFGERLGVARRGRPDGPLVWAHAASVGESLSLLPLIERLVLAWPRLRVLVTTGTVTSAHLIAGRLPAQSFHQYIPVDRVPYVRRFLDHWRPDLALWTESEFWPNLIVETQARGIPMVLVNGRVSARSFAGWRRFPGLIRTLLGGFKLCLAQTEADAARLRDLGAADAKCVGNLKFSAPPLPAADTDLAKLRDTLGTRPRWLAASTHPGEEAMAARVHRKLKQRHAGLLTIIVPRHPDRGEEITRALRAGGLNVARRSSGDKIAADTDVYVADTLGELGLFYRVAGVAFMGKSLVPLGGQNPIEAARLGCAIIHGPHMMNFEDVVERLRVSNAARRVDDEDALAVAIAALLADDAERTRMAATAEAFAAAEAGAVVAVVAELEPFIRPLAEGSPPRARA